MRAVYQDVVSDDGCLADVVVQAVSYDAKHTYTLVQLSTEGKRKMRANANPPGLTTDLKRLGPPTRYT
jgi:hypothetical protein